MEQKTLIVDCDGVLFHWNAHFNLFMHEKGYPPIPATEDNYSIMKRHAVPTYEYSRDLVHEFNESDYIRDLHPFADARHYVKKLHQEGYNFIVVTSLGDSQRAYDNREHNLDKHFGDAITELHCLPIGAPKKDVLKRWENSNFFWIEDHVENAAVGADLGLQAIVVDHPYNIKYTQHDHKLVARVSYEHPWKEIYEIVTS